jgi:hypothetical protein
MAKQTYSRRELLRMTGRLAVTVGAASVVVTLPACGGGSGGGTFDDCDLAGSATYPYYDEYGYPSGTVTYDVFYCTAAPVGGACVDSGYYYTCYDTRYDP